MIEKDRKIISLDEAVADANEKSRNRLVDESYVEEVIQKVELVKKRFRQESECQSSGVIPQEKRESLNQILDFLEKYTAMDPDALTDRRYERFRNI